MKLFWPTPAAFPMGLLLQGPSILLRSALCVLGCWAGAFPGEGTEPLQPFLTGQALPPALLWILSRLSAWVLACGGWSCAWPAGLGARQGPCWAACSPQGPHTGLPLVCSWCELRASLRAFWPCPRTHLPLCVPSTVCLCKHCFLWPQLTLTFSLQAVFDKSVRVCLLSSAFTAKESWQAILNYLTCLLPDD